MWGGAAAGTESRSGDGEDPGTATPKLLLAKGRNIDNVPTETTYVYIGSGFEQKKYTTTF